MTTILVTGFGPFPGAPINPTGALVRALEGARLPRVRLVAHVFETSYAAVDRDLPALLAAHTPDTLLMFGLAPRARLLRVETLARNVVSHLPDVSGQSLQQRTIVPGAPATRPLPSPARHLVNALCEAGIPVMRSRDAGGYLCNYTCWRAAEAVAAGNGLRQAAFIHVPLARRDSRIDFDDLMKAARAALATMAARH